MKHIITIIVITLISHIYSQGVGVNIDGSLPNNSSILDVSSQDKGILLPRVALTGTTDLTTISNGNVTSLLIYNTNVVNDVVQGYYYWDGSIWRMLGEDSDSNPVNEIQDLQLVGNILSITNNGTPTNIDLSSYLDNTDNQNIDSVRLNGTILTVYIENGTFSSVDLTTLSDHDWYEAETTNQTDNINDNIFTRGKVAIGMNAPEALLHLGGNQLGAGETVDAMSEYRFVLYGAGAGNILLAERSVGLSTRNSGTGQGGNGSNMGLHAPHKFEFFDAGNGTPFVTIDVTANNMGIGIEKPNQKLHVYGGSSLIQNSDGNNGILMFDADGLSTNSISDFASISGLTGGLSLSGLANAVTSPHMYISNSGDVGIGNILPSNKLEITSVNSNSSGLRFSNLDATSTIVTNVRSLGVDNSGDVVSIQRDETVFVGRVKSGDSVSTGYQFLPLDPIYDPENRYNPTAKTWGIPNDTAVYEINISLHRIDGAMPFTQIRPNSANIVPLPTTTGQNFYYHYQGIYKRNVLRGANPGIRLLNNSGSTYVFDNSLLYVNRGYWTITIKRLVK